MPKDTTQSRSPQSTFPKHAQPTLVVNNTIQDKEQNIAEIIVASTQPIIVITHKSAKSMASMGKYINDTFKEIPIVFENAEAKKEFFKNVGANRNNVAPQCIGHFEKSAEEYSRTIGTEACNELRQSDCIIVFGSPDTDLQKELSKHKSKTFIQETHYQTTSVRINMAIIGRMERPVDQWKSWKQRVQNSHSIC